MFAGTLPPVSQRETYVEVIEVADDDTGEPFDLTGATITARIIGTSSADDYQFAPSYDTAVLTASLGSGVTVVAAGTIEIRFEQGSIGGLAPALYRLTVEATRAGDTTQLVNLFLPVEA